MAAMTADDFAAIISKAPVAPEAWNTGSVGDAVLAAKVPELCQTCDGRGRLLGDEYEPDGNCPDCPTIAKLLAIGAAVMSATLESPKGSGPQGVLIDGKYLAQSAVQTIACLQAVKP